MPVICKYLPVRSHPRQFTRADAVRIVCKVLHGDEPRESRVGEFTFSPGARQKARVEPGEIELQEFMEEVRVKCLGQDPNRARRAQAQQQVAQAESQAEADQVLASILTAMRQLEENDTTLRDSVIVFTAIATFLSVGLAVLRFVPIPAVRLAYAAAAVLKRRVDGILVTFIARRAANDATFAALRSAAEVITRVRRAA